MRAKSIRESLSTKEWDDLLPKGVSLGKTFIEFEDIIDNLHMHLQQYNTFQDFYKSYDLNGKITIVKSDIWDEDDFSFYCGPSIGDGDVSDIVFIDEYVQKLCEELNIDVNIGIAENMHSFNTTNKKMANKYFQLLKNRIKKDFKIDESEENN